TGVYLNGARYPSVGLNRLLTEAELAQLEAWVNANGGVLMASTCIAVPCPRRRLVRIGAPLDTVRGQKRLLHANASAANICGTQQKFVARYTAANICGTHCKNSWRATTL
ncbi:hypothetical protein, partial [Rhodobacter capsulatus]|uniref:hypothetical protein n=1 Tax=Rhodobacter capsulatus TaxID=1061 RepID=UPI000B0FDFE7